MQTSALAPNAVTSAKLAREGSAGQVLTSNGAGSDPSYQSLPAGGVTSFNTRTGAVTLSATDVGTATAGLSAGAIGSYIVGFDTAATNRGSTVSAASIQYINNSGSPTASGLSGTWRNMGAAFGTQGGYSNQVTIYVRIS